MADGTPQGPTKDDKERAVEIGLRRISDVEQINDRHTSQGNGILTGLTVIMAVIAVILGVAWKNPFTAVPALLSAALYAGSMYFVRQSLTPRSEGSHRLGPADATAADLLKCAQDPGYHLQVTAQQLVNREAVQGRKDKQLNYSSRCERFGLILLLITISTAIISHFVP